MTLKDAAFSALQGTILQRIAKIYSAIQRLYANTQVTINYNDAITSTRARTWSGL